MIDDRGKPPDGSGTDDNVEILADAALAARRRPTRKLRVPNDPVPRRVDAEGSADDLDTTAVDPNHGEARVSSPGIATNADESTPRSRSVPPPPRASTRPRPGSIPPPRPGSIPPPPRVPSIPAPPVAFYDDSYDANDRTIPSMDIVDPPVVVAPAPLPPSMPSDDGGGVVRQVRRRIKSVGTGSKPPPPRPFVEQAPPPSQHDDFAIPAAADAHVELGDDFAVPPVDLEMTQPGAEALRAPAMPNVSLAHDAADLSDSDISLEESSESAEEEVLEEPTEEITIPEELLERERRRPPVPAAARATIPDAKKPPAPPPAPPKVEKSKSKEEPVPQPRKKRRPWWEEMFNDDYFRAMPKYTPSQIKVEGDFIEQSLGVEKGAVVLDIGCGDGRQAIELATRGYEMIALDLSLPMLSRAADAAQDRDAKLNFLHSDMREMEFNEMFDAAYCTNTSFGFFEDDKNTEVVQRIHRALKVGGTFLLDVVNRDYALQSQPAMTWFEADGCVCMEETSFDYIKSRLQVKRTMIMDDGRQKEAEANIRLYSLHELGLMLHQAGFRIVEVSGGLRTAGAFFGSASQQIIILAQKQKRPESTTATYASATGPAVPAAVSATVSIPPEKKE